MTLLAYSAGLVAAWWLVAPYVPQAILVAWLVACGLFCASWALICLVYAMRKPNPEETVRIWGLAANYIILGCTFILGFLIWGLLRHCPYSVQCMIGAMACPCSPAQIIASPENVAANRVGIVSTYGSLAILVAFAGQDGAITLAVFIGALGLFLFVFAGQTRSSVLSTARARIAAEQNARALTRALVAVAEERDAKTRFIAAASHDLGQPLQAASLYFDQNQRARDAASRAHAADGVRQAFAAAEQLLAHMLGHLRLEADAVDPQFAPIRVARLMDELVRQHAPAAQAAGIELRWVTSALVVHSDRVLLVRALGNLLGNAIAHSGGRKVLLGCRRAGKAGAQFWVIDNGSGVPASEQAELFSDYFRGEASRLAARPGFGLGLSSVKRIALLLGGDAFLDPRWIRGAAFCFALAPGSVVTPGKGEKR